MAIKIGDTFKVRGNLKAVIYAIDEAAGVARLKYEAGSTDGMGGKYAGSLSLESFGDKKIKNIASSLFTEAELEGFVDDPDDDIISINEYAEGVSNQDSLAISGLKSEDGHMIEGAVAKLIDEGFTVEEIASFHRQPARAERQYYSSQDTILLEVREAGQAFFLSNIPHYMGADAVRNDILKDASNGESYASKYSELADLIRHDTSGLYPKTVQDNAEELYSILKDYDESKSLPKDLESKASKLLDSANLSQYSLSEEQSNQMIADKYYIEKITNQYNTWEEYGASSNPSRFDSDVNNPSWTGRMTARPPKSSVKPSREVAEARFNKRRIELQLEKMDKNEAEKKSSIFDSFKNRKIRKELEESLESASKELDRVENILRPNKKGNFRKTNLLV
jgi:hypothetical protein